MYSMVMATVLATSAGEPAWLFHRRRAGGGCYSTSMMMGGWGGCCGGMVMGGCYGGCYGGMPMSVGCYGGMGFAGGGGGMGGMGMGGGGMGYAPAGTGGGGMAGGGSGAGGSSEVEDLRREVRELRRDKEKQRIESLKRTADELRLALTLQKLNELRRELDELKGGPGARRPLLPPPLPDEGGGSPPVLPPPMEGEGRAPAPDAARVTVKLPADARLYVNGVLCPQTSATRSFNTPTLQPGVGYFYTLRAEAVRDGRTVTESRRVYFQAGDRVDVTFDRLGTTRTARR